MISIRKSPVPHLQDVREFDKFVEEIYSKKLPKKVLEIGSFYGATLWAWIMNNPLLEELTSIDLPIPPSDGRYNEMVKCRALWGEWMDGIKFKDIQGDSHDTSTLEWVNSDRYDMIFIDGDHSYEGVKRDYEMYSPLLNKGGMIVFHDSVGYDSVKRLCDELRTIHKNEEIYFPNGWGLFIIYP